MNRQQDPERIPVSIVTGFLGSGKTTLIAALLRQPAMAGTAVIVNEFGAVGIDDAIFAETLERSDIRLLANGCLCCTPGDDLATTSGRANAAHGTAAAPHRHRDDRPRRSGAAPAEADGRPAPAQRHPPRRGDRDRRRASTVSPISTTSRSPSIRPRLPTGGSSPRPISPAKTKLRPSASASAPSTPAAISASSATARSPPTNCSAQRSINPATGRAELDRWLNLEAHRRGHVHEHAHDHDHHHDHDRRPRPRS